MSDFLRAYFHVNSDEWSGNRPFRLQAMTADELAKLPTYHLCDESGCRGLASRASQQVTANRHQEFD
jgi:hypothetical protein